MTGELPVLPNLDIHGKVQLTRSEMGTHNLTNLIGVNYLGLGTMYTFTFDCFVEEKKLCVQFWRFYCD